MARSLTIPNMSNPHEIGMSSCEYGCKVMQCDECLSLAVYHTRAYGHAIFSIQQSCTGARCTCGTYDVPWFRKSTVNIGSYLG